ncbi:hypothetical protein WH47_10399 [Habropoda laboriosa]|uniref:Uncharacterized protein n=1 Tax=Habropoda laboriosa TaxID=597456 RepID=A0A0L7R9V9_9HYME|nr:hypothetical protein WH47_10399 [Habropoda laboriosa]
MINRRGSGHYNLARIGITIRKTGQCLLFDSQRTTLVRKLHKINYPLPLSHNLTLWKPTGDL